MSVLSNTHASKFSKDYQKCGEILVAPTTNMCVLSCLYCPGSSFNRIQTFMRHLRQHSDKIKFQSSESDVMVYAVEELVNRTLCGDESEESGVAEDYLKTSEDEEFGYDDDDEKNTSMSTLRGRFNIEGVSKPSEPAGVKGATLANMSILEALEDCDVSLNFVENLDTTIVAENDDNDGKQHETTGGQNKKVCQKELNNKEVIKYTDHDDECDEGMDLDEEDDCNMDSTLLKRIQLDLELGDDKGEDEHFEKAKKDLNLSSNETPPLDDNNVQLSIEDEDLNVTMTEDNVNNSMITSDKSNKAGLKSLLCGLEGLDDVDDLLDNIEDSFISAPKEDGEEDCKKSPQESKEAKVKEDLYTRLVRESLCEDNSTQEPQSQKPDEHGDVTQNKITALELRIMADLDLDDNDLEVSLNTNPKAEVHVKPAVVLKDPITAKTPSGKRKSLKPIVNPKTPVLEKGVEVENSTKVVKKITDTPKSLQGTPKCKKISKTDTNITPTSRRNDLANKNQADLKKQTYTPKSRRTTGKDSTTPSGRKSTNAKETLVMETTEVVDTKKFEEGLTAENSSTLMYPITKENLPENLKNKDKSLKLLLDKELNGDEDLDMLINQLETSTSSGESETELNKTVMGDELSEYIKNDKEKEDCDFKPDIEPANDEEDEMAIFNKFIGLTAENSKERGEEQTNEEKEDLAEQDMDDFENLLNEDLTKALEQALDEEDIDLDYLEKNKSQRNKDEILSKHMKEKEEKHNNSLKEKQKAIVENHLPTIDKHIISNPVKPEPQEATNINLSPSTLKSKNSPQARPITNKRASPSVNKDEYQGKFSKTNKKSRAIQGKPVLQLENVVPTNNRKPMALKESNIVPLLPNLNNKTTTNTTQKQQQQNSLPPLIKGNHEAFLQQMLHEKPNLSIKIRSPAKSKANQENSPVKQRYIQRTPSSRRQPTTPQVCLSQIKKEKVTPARNFINTDRGDRTPMKVEDLFFKQSPKTQEKTGEKQRTLRTPKSPEDNLYKKSPSQCKVNLNQKTLLKTPTTKKQSSPKTERLRTPTPTKPTPPKADRLKSPAPSNGAEQLHFTTPQKTRNLSVKIQRCELQTHFKSPPHKTKTSPLSATEKNFVANNFKLPKGITISKVPSTVSNFSTTVEVTPSRSNYCKQNFTEHSLQQQLTEEKKQQSTESLIKSVPSSVTITRREPVSISSRLRARQASIDIVSGKHLQPSMKTPKPGNLDYKSYAVNRSARKKEVLQKMRHIKKQIFKSISADTLIKKANGISKSPLVMKKEKKAKVQIENVEILPHINTEKLTPLLKTRKSPQPKSPLMGTSPKTLAETSAIKLNVTVESTSPTRKLVLQTTPSPPMQKQRPSVLKNPTTPPSATNNRQPLTLKTSTTSSPPNKVERQGTLKRQATSPLQDDGCPLKKVHKSPTQERETKNTDLEATQLGLSDSVVDFLQRDLRANRINVDSLLGEEMPVENTVADQMENSKTGEQIKTTGNVKKSAEEVKMNDTATEEGSKQDSPKEDEEKEKAAVSVEEAQENDVSNKDSPAKKDVEKVKQKDTDKEDSRSNSTTNSPEAAIFKELLDQVDGEQKSTKPTVDSEVPTTSENKLSLIDYIEDYNETTDLELLGKVGLNIIKIDDFEDFQTIEEVEYSENKAKQFANVCKSMSNVFGSKQAETEDTFKLLLRNVKQTLQIDLTLSDLKRLINLIVMWYGNCYNNKLIEKKIISNATNKYLLMFHYIPKTIKRLYYCEFCEEHSTTEHRYYTHRMVHTGAKHPYRCKNCHEGFNRLNKQKLHEATCKKELNLLVKNENIAKPKTFVKPSDNPSKSEVWSKLNVRTIYNCAKCEMSFSTETDVNEHMAVCSRSVRRQPKMCTPRPKPKTEPYTKN